MKKILCLIGYHKKEFGEWFMKKTDIVPVYYLKCSRCDWSELGDIKRTANEMFI